MTVVMHCHFSRLLTHSHPRNSTSVSLTLHKGREGLAAPVPIPVSQALFVYMRQRKDAKLSNKNVGVVRSRPPNRPGGCKQQHHLLSLIFRKVATEGDLSGTFQDGML